MNRRKFIKGASGLFVPAAFSILVPRTRGQQAYLPHRRAAFRKTAAAAASTVMEFDGTDDKITYSGINTADNTYSITGWIRPANFTDSWESILTVGGGNGVYTRSSSLLVVATSINNCNSSSSLSVNTWYHFAYVNNAGSWTIYLNGSSDNTGTGGGTIGSMTHSGDNAGSDTFSGRIAQLAVFSVAISSTDVSDLKNKTKTPAEVGNLIAWLKLDEVADGASGNGTTFADSSGNGNSGTGDDGANNTGLTGRTADY